MKKVFVGMSGGVDSTITALILKKHGYNVSGVTMKIWDGPDTLDTDFLKSGCYGPGEKNDIIEAENAAKKIGIPHYVIDLSKEYKKNVLESFCSDYLAGKTPNPCILCNQKLKFGFLIDKIKEQALDFDYFATGHYLRKAYSTRYKRFFIKKGKDAGKDQSYFLYRLDQEQLEKIIFPLGSYLKSDIKKIAKQFGFVDYAQKKESQDFYEGDDLGDFFDKTKIQQGNIVDSTGKVLGQHRGIIYYTVGQRKGLNISGHHKPLYVIGINACSNQIIVGEKQELYSNKLKVVGLKWFLIPSLDKKLKLNARIRLQHREQPCTIIPHQNNSAEVIFDEPQLSITPGQSVVFYKQDAVLGGGFIV